MINSDTEWEIESEFYYFIEKLKRQYPTLQSRDFTEILEPLVRSI